MRKTTLVLGALLVLAASGMTAARSQEVAGTHPPEKPAPSIARLEISPSRLDGSRVPGAESQPILLTLAGPHGFHFEKRFPPGAPPALDLGEIQDRPLSDGPYSFELRTMGKEPEKVQSGFLSIRDGQLFVPEPAPARGTPSPSGSTPNEKTLQPKVIQGTTCIGTACVAGNEGAPLRLKDSGGSRLDFTDVADAFTNLNDWSIQANDIFVGAGVYLAIKDDTNATTPFTVTAGAPTDSLFISSGGNTGLGTATPAVRLDAKVSSSNNAVARLQNTSSSGYSAIEYLDNSGNVDLFFGIDNANSTTRLNSVNNNPILVLTNSSERMRVTSSGDIGIGTTSPTDRLDVRCADSNKTCIATTNTSGTGYSGFEACDENGVVSFFIGTDNANNLTRVNSVNSFPIVFLLNGTERLRFPTSGNVITAANGAFLSNGGTWTSVSSRESKSDVAALSNGDALKALQGLSPVTFHYKAEPDELYVGFVAEDVPELVATNDHKHLNPMDVVAVLTKVVQEQQKAIEALSADLAAVRQELKK